MRFGIGYDSHRLVEGRSLILGGIEIPHEKGLLGHSDADVLLHAICDAILGAIGEGDIGTHFPDTDPSYRNISSVKLLIRVSGLADKRGFTVNNIDATLVAERPKLKNYIPEMVHTIASVLCIEPEQVNVKATTNEGMGFIGREEGIAAYAVASMKKEIDSND